MNQNSKWLSERIVSRLSNLGRSVLLRRLANHVEDAEQGCDATGRYVSRGPTPHLKRCEKVLARARRAFGDLGPPGERIIF